RDGGSAWSKPLRRDCHSEVTSVRFVDSQRGWGNEFFRLAALDETRTGGRHWSRVRMRIPSGWYGREDSLPVFLNGGTGVLPTTLLGHGREGAAFYVTRDG